MSVNSKMTAIADAIRSLLGITGKLGLDSMASNISGIPKKSSADLSVSGATVTAPAGYYASAASKSVATVEQAQPVISVDSGGLIKAVATQSAGYVAAGEKPATKQLSVRAADVVTPGTSEKTVVAAGLYTTGAVKVAGDANLVPENIAEGVSIFGVAGTHSGGGEEYTRRIRVKLSGFPQGIYFTVYYFNLDGSNNRLAVSASNPEHYIYARAGMVTYSNATGGVINIYGSYANISNMILFTADDGEILVSYSGSGGT